MSRTIGATGRGKMQFVSDRAAVPADARFHRRLRYGRPYRSPPRGCAFVLISHVPDADV
jgi:hypothetical protein